MGISGLSGLFQTQKTEEAAGVQRVRQEREAEEQRSPGFSPKTDSVTISAAGRRMAEAMRENNARQDNEQKSGQSGTKSGLPGEVASSNADSADKAGAFITESGVVEGGTVRAVPESILTSSEQHLAKIKEKGTKVLFEFGDDGSISVKPGLPLEDYLRAQTTLREWEIQRAGLGL